MTIGSEKEKREKKRRRIFSVILTIGIFFTVLGIDTGTNDFRYLYWSAEWVAFFELTSLIFYLLLFPSGRFVRWFRLLRTFPGALLLGWYLIVLYAYVTSPLYAPENPLALNRLIPTLLYPLFFIMLRDHLSHRPEDASLLLGGVFAAGAILLLSWIPPISVLPINHNIRRDGYLLLVALIAGEALLRRIGATPRRLTLLLTMVAMSLLLLWLGGRAVLAALLLTAILLTLLRRPKMLVHTAAIGGAALLIVLLLWKNGVTFGYLDNMMQRTFTGDVEKLFSGRLDVWRLAWQHILHAPMTGEGPQACYFYPGRGRAIIHAHNVLLQFLGEWGILGTTAFLILLGIPLRRGWKSCTPFRKCSPERQAAFGGIFALGFSGLFGGTFYLPETSLMFVLLFALWDTPHAHSAE